MVDPQRLLRVLDRLEGELVQLRRLAALPDEALSDNSDLLAAAKYRLIVAIEASIDAAQHVIASEGLRAPENFGDAFVALGERELLDPQLTSSMKEAAGFRNVLVHGYADVDDRRVRGHLRTGLADLERFRATMARLGTAG